MKVSIITAAVSVLLSMPLITNAANRSDLGLSASDYRELSQRELSNELAPIKSRAQLEAYARINRGVDSPLSALSPGAQKRFLQSLVFSERGLASFDYTDLRIELTATQIYQLLRIFGLERSIGVIPNLRVLTPTDQLVIDAYQSIIFDYQDKWCSSRATCSNRIGDVCVSANC